MTTGFSLIHHAEGDYFEIRLEGSVRTDTLIAARKKITEHSGYSSKSRFLWDVRAAKVEDITLPDMLEAVRDGISQISDGTVLLWESEFQLAIGRQLMTLANIDPDKFLFTNSPEEAVNWLLTR